MSETTAEANPLANPVVRYGMCATTAAIVAFVGFQFFEGLPRIFVFVLAAMELTVAPWIIGKAVEQG